MGIFPFCHALYLPSLYMHVSGYPLYEVTSSGLTHSCSASLLPAGVCDWTLKWVRQIIKHDASLTLSLVLSCCILNWDFPLLKSFKWNYIFSHIFTGTLPSLIIGGVINRVLEIHLKLVILGVLINWSGWIIVNYVIIGGYLMDWGSNMCHLLQ